MALRPVRCPVRRSVTVPGRERPYYVEISEDGVRVWPAGTWRRKARAWSVELLADPSAVLWSRYSTRPDVGP